MIEKLNLKEVIMPSHKDGGNIKLILSRHNFELYNIRKDQQGKKPTRLMSLKNSAGQKVITFSELHLLKRQVEKHLFHALSEPITWDGGDHLKTA